MTLLTALWLPILLSSVIVFVVSSIIHMASPWHKSDFPKLPNEDAFISAVRPLAIPPGDYMVPRASGMAEMKSAEFKAKHQAGPVILMTVMKNGDFSIGSNMIQWFLYVLVVGILTAYVCAHALLPGAPYRAVFRFAGLVSFIAYGMALWPLSIWYKRDWGITLKANVDSLIYGVLTAGIFASMWPR